MKKDKIKSLNNIYNILLKNYSHQKWWPGETTDEIVIGAILTQSVSWKNVEKAINNLKLNSLCTLSSIYNADVLSIAPLIRSSLYFNQKSLKLKTFADFLFSEYQGNFNEMFKEELKKLRKKLLQIKGIGQETADSILLYAGEYPIFVIDAYTVRVFSRLGFSESSWKYPDYQKKFMEEIPNEIGLFKDYHAQIVNFGKDICKRKPKCEICPLKELCKSYEANSDKS